MAASAVELDFFRLEKESSSSAAAKLHRGRSFRDIQSGLSKISPELLKSVIVSGNVNTSLVPDLSISVPSSPELEKVLLPSNSPPLVPNCADAASNGSGIINPESAPMTIFYNGTVAVFDFPSHKVEKFLKFAGGGEEDLKLAVGSLKDHPQHQQLLETMSGGEGDLPMARKKSLQRFMQKRKQRASLACPYAYDLNTPGGHGH